MFDSGYKYMYDRYNDVYRYVPLNGDMAGLGARTQLIADGGSHLRQVLTEVLLEAQLN